MPNEPADWFTGEEIGIFGGTFDPPHIGHQILAAEARYQLELDTVLWVLTPNPPHKQGQRIAPLPLRLEMVQAAIADNPDFALSRVEIDRPPPHYALDTVRILMEQNPQARLVYLMGGDSLRDLPAWHRVAEFVEACHTLGVMRRPGAQFDLGRLESQIPGITPKIRFVDAPLLEVAASQIRERIRMGAPFRYYLPEAVFRIIQRTGLYRR
jgi:nicotinate-nucleotide adenylyltransferase